MRTKLAIVMLTGVSAWAQPFSAGVKVGLPLTDFINTASGQSSTVTAQFWPAQASQEKPFFDSGVLRSGDSFDFTFVKEGTYRYYCKFHSGMRGTITVKR